jgi:hypothetical protein
MPHDPSPSTKKEVFIGEHVIDGAYIRGWLADQRMSALSPGAGFLNNRGTVYGCLFVESDCRALPVSAEVSPGSIRMSSSRSNRLPPEN